MWRILETSTNKDKVYRQWGKKLIEYVIILLRVACRSGENS